MGPNSRRPAKGTLGGPLTLLQDFFADSGACRVHAAVSTYYPNLPQKPSAPFAGVYVPVVCSCSWAKLRLFNPSISALN
eukprot:316918-Pyramimonas_sp.AAC.1